MWFQKISIPPPWKVIGNSEGKGVSKSKFFGRKVFSEGWSGGGVQTKKPFILCLFQKDAFSDIS